VYKLILLFTLVAGLLFAQESVQPDTTARREGVDSVITYSADAIDFEILTRTTILEGNARIEYKDMELTAARIALNWDEQIMTATSTFDTLYSDSARTEIDTVIEVGRPHFKQGSEEFTGDEIAYNLKSKIGRVRGGRTVYQDGSYYGEQFKRISEDVLTVRHGEFTTCELDVPHYHFGANVLKIEVGERVVARPVYLYFADVPVLALPYGVFPIQKGRTSGFITPVFGESAAQGRFLRNIGYYWATSDYMDVLGTMDYYEEQGILGGSKFRYAKRYKLTGNVDFDFNMQRSGSTRNRRWQVSANHSHTIDQNTRIGMSGSYISDKSFLNDFGNTNNKLNQSVRSNATLSKNWNNSPWSASVNLGYTQNIQQETWSATLPAVRFTHKQGRLFPAPKAPRGIRFAATPKESSEPWYRTFTWTYNTSYSNDLSDLHTKSELGVYPDSLGNFITEYGGDSLKVRQRDGLGHQGSFAATAKILRYVNLNPSIGWQHSWTRKVIGYTPEGDYFRRIDENGFFTRTTFDVGSSASTKLYGLARYPFGIPAQFRHVMTPTVSFRYRPDFSDKEWGYFKTVSLDDGTELEYDRFRASDQSGVVGGTPSGLSEALTFSLGNLFQMKSGDAEEGTEKKFDLLSANFSSGIDFKKDSLKWSDISSSFRTALPGKLIGPIESVGLDLGTTHSMYERQGTRVINKFFWDRDGAQWYAPFDLLRASGSVDFSVRAETFVDLFKFKSREKPARGEQNDSLDVTETSELPLNPSESLDHEQDDRPPLPQAETEDMQTFLDMPVSMRFNIRHARDYVNISKTSTLGANFDGQLTPRWTMSLSYYFDLDTKTPENAGVTLTRDLHCWEASLNWSPLGFNPSYSLRIGLKSPQLRDVKIERNRGGNLRGF
jgi:hypothetical protein